MNHPLWKIQLWNYRKGQRMGKRGPLQKNKLPTQPVPVKIVHDTVKQESSVDNLKWRAQDALRDIERAEAHKQDKELMKHVKSMAKEKMDCLSKIK